MGYNSPKVVGAGAAALANGATLVVFTGPIPAEFEWDIIALCLQLTSLNNGNFFITISDDYQTVNYRPNADNMMLPLIEDERGEMRSVHRLKGALTVSITNNSGAAFNAFSVSIMVRQVPIAVFGV